MKVLPPTERDIVFACLDGGLGDNIARLPAIRAIERRAPHITARVLFPNYMLPLARLLLPESPRRTYHNYDEAKASATMLSSPAFKTRGGTHTTLKTHLVDHAFNLLVDAPPESPEDRYYPQIEPPATRSKQVILCTGYTAPVRRWPANTVNAIARWLVNNGYEPVFLGSSSTEATTAFKIPTFYEESVDYSLGLDLRDKTTLTEALQVINGAAAIVGLDNGLLHLAGCTQTPIVAAYTSVAPSLRLPPRPAGKTVALTSPTCRHCQSSTYYVFDTDFRLCQDSKSCADEIASELYIEALKGVLANAK